VLHTVAVKPANKSGQHQFIGVEMSIVSLAEAERIIDAIIAKGREEKLRPLSVVVVEPGCIVKAFKKEDGSAMMRFEMAFGKAYASLALGRSSDLVRQRAEHRPMFMEYMIGASRGQIFPEGGGQLIRDDKGDVIGAVGVTGDLQHKDDELAAYGIRAAGLKTDEDFAGAGTHIRVTRD
jgi:uncharacterized protein GlcG (DUF336 family)